MWACMLHAAVLAVIMDWLAETRAGLSLTLGPKGLRCLAKALSARQCQVGMG